MDTMMKQMLGLKGQKDVKMANNIWKMLDQMSVNNPQEYQTFIQKNIKQGKQHMQQERNKKQMKLKIKPQKCFKLQIKASLCEQSMKQQLNYKQQFIAEKLNPKKQQWELIKQKFHRQVKIYLNICHSERVRMPVDKNQQEMKIINFQNLNSLECFYYSLDGPHQSKNNSQCFYYVMVINSKFCQNMWKINQNKKILIGISLSHLEQRLQSDKNPLLAIYQPKIYGKIAYYKIQKSNVKIDEKGFQMDYGCEPKELLLDKTVDIMQLKEAKQKTKQSEKTNNLTQQYQSKQIKYKQQQQQTTKQIQNEPKTKISTTTTNNSNLQNKKIFVEQIKQSVMQGGKNNNEIPFQMKVMDTGYHFEFLIPNINSLNQLNLEFSTQQLKLSIKDGRKIYIKLDKNINPNQIQAKLRKKKQKLIVDTKYQL